MVWTTVITHLGHLLGEACSKLKRCVCPPTAQQILLPGTERHGVGERNTQAGISIFGPRADRRLDPICSTQEPWMSQDPTCSMGDHSAVLEEALPKTTGVCVIKYKTVLLSLVGAGSVQSFILFLLGFF